MAERAAADAQTRETPQRQDLTAVENERHGRVKADLSLVRMPRRRK